jgi:hypothetical protein
VEEGGFLVRFGQAGEKCCPGGAESRELPQLPCPKLEEKICVVLAVWACSGLNEPDLSTVLICSRIPICLPHNMRLGVSYKIIWWKDGQEISSTKWLDDDKAIAHPQSDFLVQKQLRSAIAFTVSDESNTVKFK